MKMNALWHLISVEKTTSAPMYLEPTYVNVLKDLKGMYQLICVLVRDEFYVSKM